MSVWERIEKYTSPDPNSGCWLWTGVCGNDNYPLITIGSSVDKSKKSARVNRLVCEAAHGLPPGMQALHKCDNTFCINPDHLYPGTPKQNGMDCIQRNRRAKPNKGEKNSRSVLSEKDVLEIRSSSEPGVVLAQRYGVSQSNISVIKSRKIWSHI